MKRDLAALLAALEGAFSHQPASDEDLCSRCRHNKAEPAKTEPKPVNRNVARIIRCGGEFLQRHGEYRLVTDEPMVVISVADLDKFVAECGKIDKV